VVESEHKRYTLGVLVQTNYGDRPLLRVDGVPVGRILNHEHTPVPPWPEPFQSSSIIVVIATDAPLLPVQCKRLAQRATIGLGRVGGVGHNGSGDIFLAFATGNHLSAQSGLVRNLQMVPHNHLNPFFEATAEAVEEAILNALTAAETMTGYQGRVVHELPLADLQKIMADYKEVSRRWY
jgi:D-aminopeptidase